MGDYEDYEKECKRIRQENNLILSRFATWLRKKQLSEDTIQKHVGNIDLYVNQFLLYEEVIEAKDGASEIGMFLGYWFIRKAMWSSVNQIKSNAASLKKFYTYMCEIGQTAQERLDDLNEAIREEMSEWIATMNRYDDQSITDMGEVWFGEEEDLD